MAQSKLLEGQYGLYRLGGLMERLPSYNVYRANRVQRFSSDTRDTLTAKEVLLEIGDPYHRRAALESFASMAEYFTDLSYPYMTRLVDHFAVGQYHYTIFELKPGTRLQFLLARQSEPSDEATIFSLVVDVARGLRYMHKRGLVFGDLSPHSIVVSPEGRSRLTDYGLARHLQIRPPNQPNLGTIGYSPPEQYGEYGVLTPACDVYALGAVAWRCITLRDPSRTSMPLTPIRQLRPNFSTGLERLVNAMVDPDSAVRPPDADALWTMLRERDPSIDRDDSRPNFIARLLGRLWGEAAGKAH